MHTLHLVYLLQAGLEVIEEGEAQLWWAGKELKETKLLSKLEDSPDLLSQPIIWYPLS